VAVYSLFAWIGVGEIAREFSCTYITGQCPRL
jgi:hypothetical protein